MLKGILIAVVITAVVMTAIFVHLKDFEEQMIQDYLDSLPEEEAKNHCGTCGAKLK